MIKYGYTRMAIPMGKYMIKIPSAKRGVDHFIYGMLANLLEYRHWNNSRHMMLAPVYHVGPFGLWLIMKRYKNILPRKLTFEERETFPFRWIDDNGHNIALDGDNFVLIDYGNVNLFYEEIN